MKGLEPWADGSGTAELAALALAARAARKPPDLWRQAAKVTEDSAELDALSCQSDREAGFGAVLPPSRTLWEPAAPVGATLPEVYSDEPFVGPTEAEVADQVRRLWGRP